MEESDSLIMTKKYVLHPSWVISKYDGDLHYIGASQLASFINVSLGLCFIHNEDRPETFLGKEYSNDLVHLYPQ